MSDSNIVVPKEKQAYLLRDREGDRYLIGTQLVTVIASAASSGGRFELVTISGCLGDSFPTHRHAQAHEGIYVMEGMVEVTLGAERFLMAPGDFAFAPAGTAHGYVLRSHNARLLSATSKGAVSKMYAALGTVTDLHVHPPSGEEIDLAELLSEPVEGADVTLVDNGASGEPKPVTNVTLPDGVMPYVIASGGGEHMVVGRELYVFLAKNANTNGELLILDNLGPKGHAIVNHMHMAHTETFLCTAGQMTMWSDDEELQMYPGDFLHVPEGSKHSFRLDAHFTRFFSLLSPGIFEPFFRTLGTPYAAGFIFPAEPGPARFDRLMAKTKAGELDLKIVGPPPDGSGGPGGPPGGPPGSQ